MFAVGCPHLCARSAVAMGRAGLHLDICYGPRQPNRPLRRLGARSADTSFFFIPPTGRGPFSGQFQSYGLAAGRRFSITHAPCTTHTECGIGAAGLRPVGLLASMLTPGRHVSSDVSHPACIAVANVSLHILYILLSSYEVPLN